MASEDRLRPLWDFGDLDLTERRLNEQLDREGDDACRAEVLTQLARVEGLRSAFARCAELLDEAERLAPDNPLVVTRVLLERGRMLRSSDDPAAAYPVFVKAFEQALAAGAYFFAGDAAHMAALAAPDEENFRAWTTHGVDLGDREPPAAYWRGPLLNNLGWRLHERGAHDEALSAFERALTVREEDRSDEHATEIARYAVAVALRALGRPADAAARAEQAVTWSLRARRPAPFFHQELAEDYAALGRTEEAAAHAKRALEIFGTNATPSQRARLEAIAGIG